MKTKIIYISGDEIFDIADIRAAFEEVRGALNLSKDTVLFGVPVDSEDAGLSTNEDKNIDIQNNVITEEAVETVPEIIDIQETDEIVEKTDVDEEPEPVKKAKKSTRSRKKEKVVVEEPVEEPVEESVEEKVVPILSVLSVNDDESEEIETETDEIVDIAEPNESQTEILTDEETEQITDTDTTEESSEESQEPDLEQLLSAMKPLAEDSPEESLDIVDENENITKDEEDNIDATLEQLATEFVKNQDKISAENKNSSRSKIGKLRNILPFKQTKHKDQGLGDLFGWAGIAANDEDFSVPGFFTNASSRK